jgi:hypothetical protein
MPNCFSELTAHEYEGLGHAFGKVNQENGLKRTAVCRCMCLSGQWTLQTFCKILPHLDSHSALAPRCGCSFGHVKREHPCPGRAAF